MTDVANQDGKDETLPPLRPPLIKSVPASLRRYAADDPTPHGDQSVVLDDEDERILDEVWAEVAHHPRMAADPDVPGEPGTGSQANGRGKRRASVTRARPELPDEGRATPTPNRP